MARWGKADFRQLERLQEKLASMEKVNFDKFCEEVAKELAARLLAKVIKRTPVGNYTDGTMGGTLRRGWTADSEREAELAAAFGGGNAASKYAKGLEVTKTGGTYRIEIINPVHYASYVEYGHRTANHKGWVDGRFMLTISEREVDGKSKQVVEKKLMKYLGEVFNGK